ncbi:hypothetical protein BS333_19445 [Vibrio azureus]|uniref:Uncharacterized protein n=1 Tax=Vibrio azureus NBRC 104587 TaxID=1219077 RepID=U3CIW5_9VIBR|nr:hypothetical protein [Vibrio azureus]AUI88498.1 hypothetical protein BS333_19445 [Vibrio azureus]GAD78183.1 hypothetical protein VAZ01S_141_00010 [Vibrio azureus NBRC 104587]
MIRVYLVIALSFCLIGCPGSEGDTGDINVDIGNTKLSIPKKYLLSGFPQSLVAKGKEFDVEKSILLGVPVSDLGFTSKSHSGLIDQVTTLISGLSNRLNPDAVDAWNRKGLFENRIVEFDDEMKLYRVYPEAGYPTTWHYFKTSPIVGGEFRLNWVSSCMSPPGTDGKDLSKVYCHLISYYKTVEIQMSLYGDNIKIMNSINSSYLKLLSSWEVNSK